MKIFRILFFVTGLAMFGSLIYAVGRRNEALSRQTFNGRHISNEEAEKSTSDLKGILREASTSDSGSISSPATTEMGQLMKDLINQSRDNDAAQEAELAALPIDDALNPKILKSKGSIQQMISSMDKAMEIKARYFQKKRDLIQAFARSTGNPSTQAAAQDILEQATKEMNVTTHCFQAVQDYMRLALRARPTVRNGVSYWPETHYKRSKILLKKAIDRFKELVKWNDEIEAKRQQSLKKLKGI